LNCKRVFTHCALQIAIVLYTNDIIFVQNLMIYSKKAFTFVELIIVVWVISLLGIIWVTQYVDYASKIRDASRLSQVTEIYNGIEASIINNRLDTPGNQIEIISNGKLLWYQGDISTSMLESIDFTAQWVDPKTNQYYSVLMDKNKKNFQIMGFLENYNEFESEEDEYIWNTSPLDKNVIIKWENLWILTDNFWVPVQRINFLNWKLDISTTQDEYISFFSNNYINTGTWSTHDVLKTVLKRWRLYEGSCNNILSNDDSLEKRDWVYAIGTTSWEIIEVYCNMTFEWWGWTLFYANNGSNNSTIKKSYVSMRDDVIQNDENVYDLTDYDFEYLAWVLDYRNISSDDQVELLAVNRNEFLNGSWVRAVFSNKEIFNWALWNDILWANTWGDQCIDIINNGEISYYFPDWTTYLNLKQVSKHNWANIWISHSNDPCNWYSGSVSPHLLFYVANYSNNTQRTRSTIAWLWQWWWDNQYRYFMR